MKPTLGLGKFAKAIYSGLVAGLSGLATVLDGGKTFEHVSAGQWVTLTLAALVSAGGVYGITNGTAKQ